MDSLQNRKKVELLIDEFWKQGYLTVSRKYGNYLSEPSKVGNYEVDIIARLRKQYAIGIILNQEDFADANLIEKLEFLASRQTKFTNSPVKLFIGISPNLKSALNSLLKLTNPDLRENISVALLSENEKTFKRQRGTRNYLFA